MAQVQDDSGGMNDGASQAASRQGSFKGSETSSMQGKELTDDEKKRLFKARIVMLMLLIVYIICAVLEAARLPLCALQLISIGGLCLVWEEDSFVFTSDGGIARKLRGICCQMTVALVPLATASWILMIYIGNITDTADIYEGIDE